ncbi:NnrS family protein [Biformimicrobium ophioploci]|uniref:NnrS family protein n=1 Tax=Biformimicrobium ophioploci TaxID=3036711 RepID=A0ABQ6LW84_9GAMM|nr:NnrS family protein [Microbulbifer sp. NKW57]GMG86366.1 NnrS family protein [Microbulbifer sp. NKW57]
MMQIVDRSKEEAIAPIWRMPFRPFFWGAAAWSLLALILWQAQLSGWVAPAFSDWVRGGITWHAHEMLFAFAATVVVGFLGTAIQTWTGVPSPKGWPLIGLVGLWLAARLGYLFAAVPLWLPLSAEAIFFLTAALLFGRRILLVKQWRNLFVLPAMLAFAALALCHWLLPAYQARVALLALLLVVAIILVVGGRVIPFFTARRLQLPQRDKWALLEIGGHVLMVVLLLAVALNLPQTLWAWLALALGVLQLVRMLRWHPTRIWVEPLLWSLHISYWLLVLGFFIAALAWSGLAPAWHSAALHAFAVGGIGGLILAMISRVSLGHTGRQLQAPGLMPLAFAALALSALARIFWAPAPAGFVAAVAGWVLGYGLFLVYYTPVLFRARVDGQGG